MTSEFRRFCRIVHLLANYVDSFAGDLFLDLCDAWEEYEDEKGNWPVFCIRKTGADLLTRFEKVLIQDGNENPTFEECIECGQKYLGIDFAVEITPYKVIITNYKVEKWALGDLETRLRYDLKEEVEIINNKED